MASISKERMREMEEEMDRFEAEIQGPGQPPGGSFILGASTFDQVQAQLSTLRQESSRRQQRRRDSSSEDEPEDEDLRYLPRRPMPPVLRHVDIDERESRNGAPIMRPGVKRSFPPEENIDGEFFDIDERPGRPQGPRIAPPPPPPPPPPGGRPNQQNDIPLSTVLAPPPPPPPGMPPELKPMENTLSFEPYQPGEGPTRPAFMPPQLRHRMPMRPPPPPGLRPPPFHPRHPMGMGGPPGPFGRPPGPPGPPQFMGGPPHMGPGPNGPPMGPPMNMQQMGMPGGPGIGPQIPGSGPVEQGMGPYAGPVMEDPNKGNPSIEQPKVVYAAAPQINITRKKVEKKTKKKKKKQKEDGKDEANQGASSLDTTGATSVASSVTTLPVQEDMSIANIELVPDSAMMGGIVAGGQAVAGAGGKKEKKKKEKKFIRLAASTTWEDPTLSEWQQDDFRIFAGDLGNEVTDETLVRAFNKYPSFLKAKVVRDRRSNKSKGYGFVSFKDPMDFARAMREMNGKYVGNRPIKLRKSSWKDRNIEVVRKKDKEKKRLGLK